MNVFDFSLKLNGFPIAKAKRVLKNIQSKTENDFNAFAEVQKRAIVAYHLEHNPFYKSFGKQIDLNDWNSIPVMTKADLQQPLEQRLSEGFTRKNIYINKTSGSSGHPFLFAKDKFCHALTWAVIQNRFGWYNINFNSSKQARFYGIPLDKAGYYKERFKDFLSHRYRFSVFDLSDEAFEATLQKFKTTTFHYINGYTSAIVQFGKFLQQKNVILKSVCPSLNVCVVTSEMLFEVDKTLLETQFGIPIVNEYGASELDLIAFQNPNGNWQLNSETLFIEILDEHNNVLPHGETGRIVITSLYNKAHPFIRYDIGDIGVISKKSTPKTPILENLTGRTNDIVILPSGKKAAGLTFYYITKSIIENDGIVKEFVIEQLKLDTFKIIYVGNERLSEAKKQTINQEIEHYLESGLQIIYEKQNNLNRQKSGKLKQFTSHLNQN
ncbi:AMP-binding protein [Tamlana nanhaiensis]|uniref:AMP-binding protein n=1 Tax=Neotamlana nanhaiensis TaxID=1382798 RepID=A0A0D7W4Z3_9FLAO|nr:phenylacetate--CoA ligase family protein [Tamlana nanhaiensis]KJD34119.1 AMP-binding protein [Tamlana nanhaiensis]